MSVCRGCSSPGVETNLVGLCQECVKPFREVDDPFPPATPDDRRLFEQIAMRYNQDRLPAGNPPPTINPKDAIGATKLPLELWPAEATALGSLGMLEGALKYGRNNFIAGDGVIASIYAAAAKRHIDAWFEGENDAPDSLSPHLGNALASLAIIVKAQAHGKLIDDRNYSPNPGAYRRFMDSLTPHVARLKEMFKDKHPKHWTIQDNE